MYLRWYNVLAPLAHNVPESMSVQHEYNQIDMFLIITKLLGQKSTWGFNASLDWRCYHFVNLSQAFTTQINGQEIHVSVSN